ncbi:carboxypeptidase regulatory-like domain-containing protein [Natronocalculus amylovorans]|uniref:PKD domain-containing protein n=1 Tax=Natronocalculus amylovorans TaxID=2917812 RepID=A0AAE3FZD2_9EURY|nr:carboxypeptidase regulatory-like domain-containing protein [Natronocalculus amylovorans]MCL9817444.1 PKD domain-containing protein [Natronocalculus amylovorans]
MSGQHKRLFTVLIAIAMLLSVVAVGGVGSVVAQEDSPEPIPASYYGQATIGGEPVPEGTVITAEVNGEERGSITVTEDGAFGGPAVGDDKLVVNASDDEAGEEVTFLVAGEEVETDPDSVTWESGAVEEITLAGDDIDIPVFDLALDEDDSTLAVEEGETATVAVSVTNTGDSGSDTLSFEIDGDEVDTETIDIDAGDTETVTFTETLDTVGEIDAAVVSAADRLDVTLEAEEADDDDPAPSPPSDPSPPPADDDDDDADEADEEGEDDPADDPEEDVVDPVSSSTAAVSVDTETNRSTARFENVSVSSVSFDSTEIVGDTTVESFERAQDSDPDASDPPGSTGTVQRITVPDGAEDTAALISFSVDLDAVPDADPEDYTPYRLASGEWEQLDVESRDIGDDTVTIEAETPGFSTFAVSAVETPDAVAAIEPTEIAAGDTATLSAAESTDRYGEIVSYEWVIDGDVVGTDETVDVSPDAGEYDVVLTVTNDAGEEATDTAVLSVDAGEQPVTVTVTDEDDSAIADATVTIDGQTETTDENGDAIFELADGDYTASIAADGFVDEDVAVTVDGETTVTGTLAMETDDGIPGFGIPVALTALLLLTIGLHRRQ